MRDGTLTVAVKSSVWKNELALMRSKITEALNEKLGEPVVKRITFSSAWPQEATGQGTASSGSEDEACELRPIPSPEEAEIRQAVSRIDDDRVSGALFAAWTTKRSLDMGRKALGWNECPACGALKRPEDSACPVCASRKG
jgi:predicted nucleic acid-binding Zn ribbon protein